MVIPGHNLGNSQVSVYRTIGPTLGFLSGQHTRQFNPIISYFSFHLMKKVCILAIFKEKITENAVIMNFHFSQSYITSP